MAVYDKIKGFILKLRSLPETQKAIIFFTIIIISTLIILFWTIKSTKNNISKIRESLKSINLPKIDLPETARQNEAFVQDLNNIISDITSNVSKSDSKFLKTNNQEVGD